MANNKKDRSKVEEQKKPAIQAGNAEAAAARTEPERGKGKPTKGNDPLKVSGLNEGEAEVAARKTGTRESNEPALGADTGSHAPFGTKHAGDKLSKEKGASMLGKSQVYRDKYAEVMRDFHAGQLRGKTSNMVIRDDAEARAMAAEQAKIADDQSRA